MDTLIVASAIAEGSTLGRMCYGHDPPMGCSQRGRCRYVLLLPQLERLPPGRSGIRHPLRQCNDEDKRADARSHHHHDRDGEEHERDRHEDIGHTHENGCRSIYRSSRRTTPSSTPMVPAMMTAAPATIKEMRTAVMIRGQQIAAEGIGAQEVWATEPLRRREPGNGVGIVCRLMHQRCDQRQDQEDECDDSPDSGAGKGQEEALDVLRKAPFMTCRIRGSST